MNAPDLQQSYDAVPYTSRPVPQAHPDRLYAMARLHGLAPAPVESARVLELGCGRAGNLLAMACRLPRAEFVGIDLSPGQIATARADAAALELDNVTLIAGDIRDSAPPGGFDYAIAHGLYSWVPLAVQARLPAIVAGLLAPNGIAYVSYNTYPGWQQRAIVRRFLLDAVTAIEDPAARVAQARAALDVLVETERAGGAYGAALAEERRRVAALDDSFVLHDLLEAENHPVWFRDFAAHGASAGLAYICESNLSARWLGNFPPAIRPMLAALDPIAREQHIDFWLGRSLRESLLCRADDNRPRPPRAAALAGLWAGTELRRDGSQDGETFYRGAGDPRIGLRERDAIGALDRLVDAAPGSVEIEPDSGALTLYFELACRNLIELSPRPADFVTAVGDRPRACGFARWQARGGSLVTNRRHQSVLLDDPLAARLLPALDGRQSRESLRRTFGAGVDASLAALAGRALLIA